MIIDLVDEDDAWCTHAPSYFFFGCLLLIPKTFRNINLLCLSCWYYELAFLEPSRAALQVNPQNLCLSPSSSKPLLWRECLAWSGQDYRKIAKKKPVLLPEIAREWSYSYQIYITVTMSSNKLVNVISLWLNNGYFKPFFKGNHLNAKLLIVWNLKGCPWHALQLGINPTACGSGLIILHYHSNLFPFLLYRA